MSNQSFDSNSTIGDKVYRTLIGKPRDLKDPSIFHKLALVPILAWIGLGADGLSSSAYGPEEIFRVLGEHRYLAIILILAIPLTVFIISYAYSRIIEHFPNGGGGYIVASQMLGEKAGVLSGSALIIDYILTVTVSIVSCSDAIFSYLPPTWQNFKIVFATLLILLLILLNIRGVKESITILAPIFFIFIATHILLIGYGIISNYGQIGAIANSVPMNYSKDVSSIGLMGIFLIIIRAYSLGGGTYTGIEAISNGLQVMREPKVKNGKRTMLYLAVSLSLAAGGLMVCYMLSGVNIISGKTLNAVLADKLYSHWHYGWLLAIITIGSEGALLFVAAQAGFIDAPRVMANMALDNWLPRKFATLSDRLTMKNGIIIIGIASLILLYYTNGSIGALVLMYSINVFLTFSLSEFGMIRFYYTKRKQWKDWKSKVSIHVIGFILCFTVLNFTIYEKFMEGGWVTLVVTGSLVLLCFMIKKHYDTIRAKVLELDSSLPVIQGKQITNRKINHNESVAIQLVDSFNGLGFKTFESIQQTFPKLYKNIIFVSVGVIDQGLFKGEKSLENIAEQIEINLESYCKLANSFGLNADFRYKVGVDIADSIAEVINELKIEYPNITVFSGKLAFQKEKFYHRILHNQTANTLQNRLQLSGITNVILSIKINLEGGLA